MSIFIQDNVFPWIEEYLQAARQLDFKTYEFGPTVFHGIGFVPVDSRVPDFIREKFGLTPSISFVRRSPAGQVEPHDIHTDIDMGDWSALLYLNPSPDEGDGTNFWTHRRTGTIESFVPHEWSHEGTDRNKWDLRQHVEAKFNRLVMFPSSYFHSRAIFENYGDGDGARLVQVTFGTGDLKQALALGRV